MVDTLKLKNSEGEVGQIISDHVPDQVNLTLGFVDKMPVAKKFLLIGRDDDGDLTYREI